MPSGRPLTPEDVWALRRVGPPEPAPDASFLIVPMGDLPAEGDEPRRVLYRVPTGGGDPAPLTSHEHDSFGPAVSPDGSKVAFARKVGGTGKAQLAMMPLDGGEAEVLTDLPLGIGDVRWLPDGSGVVLLAPLLREAPDVAGTSALVVERERDPIRVRVTEDRLYRFWDRWLVGGSVHHLFRYDLGSGVLTDLMPGSTRWFPLMEPSGTWDVAPDGSQVAFSANTTGPPYAELNYAIHLVPTDGSGTVTRLFDDVPGHQRTPRYAPSGRWLLYGTQLLRDFYADRVRLTAYDRAAGTETVLTEEWDRSAEQWEFTAAGDRIVLAAEDRARMNLFTMAVEPGTPEPLVAGGWARDPRPATDGSVFFRLESLQGPAEVHRVPAAGGPAEPVTHFTADQLSGLTLGDVVEIEVAGAGGEPVQAFLVHPPGHDPARPAPLVQMVHGGPHGAFGDMWHVRWNAQAIAARGHVVAMPNFHGSSGFGDEYQNSIFGEWGDKPAQDVLAVTDHLVDAGVADPGRMAVIGGSYGGYLVAWLIGATDRFAAAVCHAGVTNLLGQWASDVTFGRQRSMGAEPWEDPERILRWSPTSHMANIVTPTLVVHGERDYRVVVTQGLELYGILKAKGVEARLVYYPDENHWILDRRNSLHWYGEVLGWLDRHLGEGGGGRGSEPG